MVKTNELSVEKVIEWAYSQFTDKGVEPWIEKITLALDKSDVLDVLNNNFKINEKLSIEIQAGKIADMIFPVKRI